MRTRRLALIRHSTPEIRPEVPAARWTLSAEGVARARAFAAEIDPGTADRAFTSTEPKAVQTAHALGELWKLPVEQVPGAHEHERPEARMRAREQFEVTIRELFARPSELVFGAETAEDAGRRFTHTVWRLVEGTERDVVLVSHGTVIALFVAAHAGPDAFEFWRQQQMPCAVTFALPAVRFERLILPQ